MSESKSKNPSSKRNYHVEYNEYQGTPEQIKHRSERNKARRELEKDSGKALSGDVAHIHSLKSGGSDARSNLRVETVKKNRSWRKGQKGYNVPQDK